MEVAPLFGSGSCGTETLRKYKSYASSLRGRVPASPWSVAAPSAGTSPWRTFDVICPRIEIMSSAPTFNVSRHRVRLFSTSTASSVICSWSPSFRKWPVTMSVTCISRPACCRSRFAAMYLLVVAKGRMDKERT